MISPTICGPRMIYTLKSTYCLIPQSVGYLFGKHEFYARFHKFYLGYTSCKQRRLNLLGHMHFKDIENFNLIMTLTLILCSYKFISCCKNRDSFRPSFEPRLEVSEIKRTRDLLQMRLLGSWIVAYIDLSPLRLMLLMYY